MAHHKLYPHKHGPRLVGEDHFELFDSIAQVVKKWLPVVVAAMVMLITSCLGLPWRMIITLTILCGAFAAVLLRRLIHR